MLAEDSGETAPPRPRDSLKLGILAALGFILWGLWANWQYGWGVRLQVALTQGVISLVSTYYSAELVVWMVSRFRSCAHPVGYAGFTSYVAIYVLVFTAHLVAGTPELLLTMLPGLITGLFFCFGYAWRVWRYQ